LEASELIGSVRAAERMAMEAALSGSRKMAVQALAMHPLVLSTEVAGRILQRHLIAQPQLGETLR
jgi:6-phospho-beta-glucosidase